MKIFHSLLSNSQTTPLRSFVSLVIMSQKYYGCGRVRESISCVWYFVCSGIWIVAFFFLIKIFLWECGFWISWSQLNFYFSSTYICHSPFGVVWYYDLMWGVFVFVFFLNEFGFWMLAPNGTTFSSFCSSVHIYLSSQLTLWSGLNFEVMWCPTLVVQSGWRKNGMNE